MLGIPFTKMNIEMSLRGQQKRSSRMIGDRIIIDKGEVLVIKNKKLIKYKPHYMPGIYYVKEPHCIIKVAGAEAMMYKYKGQELPPGYKWISHRYLKESDARYIVEITGWKVQRLNAMTSQDYEDEGIISTKNILLKKEIFIEWWNNSNRKKIHSPSFNPYIVGYYHTMREK